MYKLEFTLKQHTPLIHFQYDQEGATLRASEVKPKLDRFIIEKLGNGDFKKGTEYVKNEGWLVGRGEHEALDYKLKIISTETPSEFLITSYLKKEKGDILERSGINTIPSSPYFAQEEYTKKIFQGDNGVSKLVWNSIPKKGIMCQKIKLFIFCYKIELQTKISELIHEFFICENFGTRQSKGFGCFEIIEPQPRKTHEVYLKENFKFVYLKSLNPSSLKNIFEEIQHDYKLLKSGRNRDGRHQPYAKSKLFLYGLRMNPSIRWEKRFLKLSINDIYPIDDNEDTFYQLKVERGNSSNYGSRFEEKSWDEPVNEVMRYRYLRAILGLTEQFEFIVENYNEKFKIKASNKSIERFKSPLTIKVLSGKIFIVGNDIPDDLKGDFEFAVSLKGSGYEGEDADVLESKLKIPENFSLPDFMKFAMGDNTNGASLGYTAIKE